MQETLKTRISLKDKAKYEVFTCCWMTTKQRQKKHPLQILKDPFITPGCAVNLAESNIKWMKSKASKVLRLKLLNRFMPEWQTVFKTQSRLKKNKTKKKTFVPNL